MPDTAGLVEESADERRAAKKGFFPSSMGLSFLVSEDTCALDVTVRWGDYTPGEAEDADGKPLPVWQRRAKERTVRVDLSAPPDHRVPASGGLRLHVVSRPIDVGRDPEHVADGAARSSIGPVLPAVLDQCPGWSVAVLDCG